MNSTPQQNPSFSVSCAVPRSGRTLQNFLYKLIQLGADSDEIESIVEDNKLKQGKLLPGVKIPIVSKSQIKGKPDCALVLAWNFFEEIKKKNSDLAHKFISIKDLEI